MNIKPNIFSPKINSEASTKKSALQINHRDLIKDSYYKKTEINAQNVAAKVEFLDTALNSHKDSDIKFTNFLHDEKTMVDTYIKECMSAIQKDPTLVCRNCSEIKPFGVHKDRIAKVLIEFVGEEIYNKFEDSFRKTSIAQGMTAINGNGKFRVITIYTVDPKKREHKLSVVFIDIYHLFIPSDLGKKKWDQVLEETYDKNKDHTTPLKTHFSF